MSSQGTPIAGLNLIAQAVFGLAGAGQGYRTLVAYTNAQGTLGNSTVLSDLVQPTQANGYAPILLDGTWAFANGVSTYTHDGTGSDDGFGNPCWVATGSWSAPVTGVAIVLGSVVQHFVDYNESGAFVSWTAAAGKKLTTDIAGLAGIRFTDVTALRGQLLLSLSGLTAAINATHTAPPARNGIIQPQLTGLIASVTGLFSPGQNNNGSISTAMTGMGGSFTGLFRAAVQAGAPLVLYTDFTDIPTGGVPTAGLISGSAALYQGENGAGGYLSIFGVNFGSFANLGTAAGARVFLGGAEVANYRVLDLAVVSANNPVFPIQRLIVQVGSAAVQALSLGVPVALSVVVNGTASNVNDTFGIPLTFTPVQAPIYFIDETNGNNSNAGTIDAPLKQMQTYTGGTFGGALVPAIAISGGKTNGTQAGTQFVLRGGTYALFNTHDNRFAEYFRNTGSLATLTISGGVKGVNVGALKTTAYPGPILGNTCELPFISNTGAGGFLGSDSQRATVETSPFGTPFSTSLGGYAKFCQHSNLKIAMSSAQTASDAAPIYMDNAADGWRNVNNDLSFAATHSMLSAAISGDGANQRNFGNYIHDVQNQTGADLQNHAIYMDGGSVYNTGCISAFNYIKNITGGNGIQQFNNKIDTATDLAGNPGFTNNIVAYNWIDGTAKYGLNIADSSISGQWYGNVVLNTTLYGIRTNTESSNLALTIMNNTVYNACGTGAGLQTMFSNEWNAASGFIEVINNALVMGAARTGTGISFYNNNATDSAFIWKNNLYFDPEGHASKPTGGTRSGEIQADPKFTTPYTNFAPGSGSPLINTGTTSAHLSFAYDLGLNAQPRGGSSTLSIGALA